MNIQAHPEIDQIRKSCVQLRAKLRDVVNEMFRLSNEIRPQLTELYDKHFGEEERELQRLAIENADIARRVELLTIKVARGEQITASTVEIVNAVVDKEFARFRERLKTAFSMTDEERNRHASAKGNDADDGELVKMYRTLARKLHPDSGTEPDASPSRWHKLQTAYRQRNLTILRSMLGEMDETIDDDLDAFNLEQLSRESERLNIRIRMEERKLQRLKGEEPFVIANDLTNDHWIRMHLAELKKTIVEKQTELKEHHDHYRDITGGNYTQVKSEETKDPTFGQDFMEHTYMGQR